MNHKITKIPLKTYKQGYANRIGQVGGAEDPQIHIMQEIAYESQTLTKSHLNLKHLQKKKQQNIPKTILNSCWKIQSKFHIFLTLNHI
jgi:hypothetical protein